MLKEQSILKEFDDLKYELFRLYKRDFVSIQHEIEVSNPSEMKPVSNIIHHTIWRHKKTVTLLHLSHHHPVP